MSKVHYAIVISSQELQDVVGSTLRKHDVIYSNPLPDPDKYLYSYIKQNASDLTNYDSIIIDLGSLRDTNEQIMESLESIRFLDDKMRVIILEGGRSLKDSNGTFQLLHHCFLNGIYDLIFAGSYLDIRAQLEKSILYGMSYKDSLIFKDETTFKKATTKVNNELLDRTICIFFAGVKNRIGVTHCALATAYTLSKSGYIVALVDCTGSTDYLQLMHSYEQKLTEEGYFTLHDIDIYIKPSNTECIKENAYNYVIYDVGHIGRVETLSKDERDSFRSADERILLCGSKAWELDELSEAIKILLRNEVSARYLFNFTVPEMYRELCKMMKAVEIPENHVHIMDYIPDPFSESPIVREIIGVQKKKKKGLFRK